MSEKKYPSQKQKQVSFRLTDKELAKVQALATSANMTLAEYAKHATLRMKVQAAAAPPEMMGDIFGELGHIGSNLNQLARRTNESGDAPTIAELDKILEAYNAIFDCIADGKKLPKREKSNAVPERAAEQAEPPAVAEPADHEREVVPPTCELCGATMVWRHKGFWGCPNWNDGKGEHSKIWPNDEYPAPPDAD